MIFFHIRDMKFHSHLLSSRIIFFDNSYLSKSAVELFTRGEFSQFKFAWTIRKFIWISPLLESQVRVRIMSLRVENFCLPSLISVWTSVSREAERNWRESRKRIFPIWKDMNFSEEVGMTTMSSVAKSLLNVWWLFDHHIHEDCEKLQIS